jgi:hypothetical protein
MNAVRLLEKTNLGGRIVLARPSQTGEVAFKYLTWFMAMMVFVLVAVIGWELSKG